MHSKQANDYNDVYFDEVNEVKSDNENDSSYFEEEIPDEFNDDGYNEYDGYGEHNIKGYYYHDGRYERKILPMMSPIISPVTI